MKIVICKYYLENKCKYKKMECSYAHGVDDINIIECKYGVRCVNTNCIFDHGVFNLKIENIYSPVIIYKNKKHIKIPITKINKNDVDKKLDSSEIEENNKKDHKYSRNIENKLLKINQDINIHGKDTKSDESEIEENCRNIENKHLFINQDVNVHDNNKNNIYNEIYYNKLINTLDNYYYNIINQKNIIINNLLNKIKLLNIPKTSKTSTNLEKYKKYHKLNDAIFSSANYDNITKDKNIYKLKLRCSRIKTYMEIVKKYDVKDILPISKILNSTKTTFSNILNNIITI